MGARVYGALLRLYPAAFRAEYGGEMRALFARRLEASSGLFERALLWMGALLDVLPNAARVHWDILRQDVAYTSRMLRRSPGFAVTAILVAALGIGAATATFSVLDHVLIRPLPFPEPERLVNLWEDDSYQGYSQNELSPANFRDWKRMSTSFEGMAAHWGISANLVGGGDPVRLDGASVTSDLFELLGARAAIGRVLTPDDDRPGAAATLLLSHRVWQGRFGGDPGALGRKVILNDEPHVIVGVMPPGFQFPSRDAQFWRALRLAPRDFEDRTDTYLRVTGRLRRGVPLDRARAEMKLVAARLERAYPKENIRRGASVVRLRDQVSSRSRLLLAALFGAAVGVLLIACTNLASLLLARALSRRPELAVRAAMGAGRERLVRQLLTESLLLAAAGGALGILAAVAAGPLAGRLVPSALPIAGTPPVDLRMLVFAAVVTVLTGIAFGVVPALRAFGDADSRALKEEARAGAGRRTERLRAGLVIAEVAASVTLLICSGLLIRALWRLQETDPGFRADGVLTLRTALPMPRYEKTGTREQFYARVLSQVREQPGVSAAGYITSLPMVMRGGVWPVAMEGQPVEGSEETVSLRFVTPGLFAALGVPQRLGRDVAESDTQKSLLVAVVSESFVKRHWPGEHPVGRRFQLAQNVRTVVGVVGDVRVRGLESESEPQVYLPSRQAPDGGIIGYVPKDLVIRSSVPPATLLPSIRGIIAGADPQLPVSDVQTLASVVDADTAPRRVQARVVGAFAAIAFLLAAVGIHGLLAFTVSQRKREIGVRIALGARPSDILRMVLRRGVLLAAAGIGVGVVLALAAGRAMAALLVGLSPADPATLGTTVALALAMTLAGSLLPALRAVRVNPASVIRAE